MERSPTTLALGVLGVVSAVLIAVDRGASGARIAALEREVAGWKSKMEAVDAHRHTLAARLDTVERAPLPSMHAAAERRRLETIELDLRRALETGDHKAMENFESRLRQLEAALHGRATAEVPHAAAPAARRLDSGDGGDTGASVSASADLALISIDAPAGAARLVLGGEEAGDNVILHKAHASAGAGFTLSRNATLAMRVDLAGAVEMAQDPFTVRSTVKASNSEPLVLGGAGEGISLQDSKTFEITEVDGATSWSRTSLLIFTGDTVRWSWTNFHNLVEISSARLHRLLNIQSDRVPPFLLNARARLTPLRLPLFRLLPPPSLPASPFASPPRSQLTSPPVVPSIGHPHGRRHLQR